MPKRKNILNTDDTDASQDFTGWRQMPVTQAIPSRPSPGLAPADLMARMQARQTAAFPSPPAQPSQAAPSYLSGQLPQNPIGMTGGDFDKMLGINSMQGNQLQGPGAGSWTGGTPPSPQQINTQLLKTMGPPPGGGNVPMPPPYPGPQPQPLNR